MSAIELEHVRKTFGDFVAVNAYMVQLFVPLNLLGFIYREIRRALTDMQKMFGLLEQHSRVQDAPGAQAITAPRARVAFERVSFGYTPARRILDDVSLEIPEGRKLAVVGASGAGKSELGLELLSRGHKLVADDIIEWHLDGDRVVGRCPPLLDGFIEVRGLGILNARALYGEAAVIGSAPLDLIIDLGVRSDGGAEERLHGRRGADVVLGVGVPEISLPRRVGHNLAVLVEAACRDHRLRLSGYRADDDLVERQRRNLGRSEP